MESFLDFLIDLPAPVLFILIFLVIAFGWAVFDGLVEGILTAVVTVIAWPFKALFSNRADESVTRILQEPVYFSAQAPPDAIGAAFSGRFPHAEPTGAVAPMIRDAQPGRIVLAVANYVVNCVSGELTFGPGAAGTVGQFRFTAWDHEDVRDIRAEVDTLRNAVIETIRQVDPGAQFGPQPMAAAAPRQNQPQPVDPPAPGINYRREPRG